MILHPHGDGFVAIAQSSHAFLAFQIADHWGNRLTLRPSPRAEVLAAVLLHDAGWDGREEPPRLAEDGRPVAFDTASEAEREAVWTASVERAAWRGRYVAYLVSHHVSTLAEMGADVRWRTFRDGQEAHRARLRAELAADPRYRSTLAADDAVNRAVVRLSDSLAVLLAGGATGATVLAEMPRRGGTSPLAVREVAPRTYRLRPWPLVGRRLDLSAEGRLLPARRFADEATLRDAWRSAPVVRLGWTLLAAGTTAD